MVRGYGKGKFKSDAQRKAVMSKYSISEKRIGRKYKFTKAPRDSKVAKTEYRIVKFDNIFRPVRYNFNRKGQLVGQHWYPGVKNRNEAFDNMRKIERAERKEKVRKNKIKNIVDDFVVLIKSDLYGAQHLVDRDGYLIDEGLDVMDKLELKHSLVSTNEKQWEKNRNDTATELIVRITPEILNNVWKGY